MRKPRNLCKGEHGWDIRVVVKESLRNLYGIWSVMVVNGWVDDCIEILALYVACPRAYTMATAWEWGTVYIGNFRWKAIEAIQTEKRAEGTLIPVHFSS